MEHQIQELSQDSIPKGTKQCLKTRDQCCTFSLLAEKKETKLFQLQLLGRLTTYFLDREIMLILLSTFLYNFSMENFYQIKVLQHHQALHTVNAQQMKLLTNQKIFLIFFFFFKFKYVKRYIENWSVLGWGYVMGWKYQSLSDFRSFSCGKESELLTTRQNYHLSFPMKLRHPGCCDVLILLRMPGNQGLRWASHNAHSLLSSLWV